MRSGSLCSNCLLQHNAHAVVENTSGYRGLSARTMTGEETAMNGGGE